MARVLIVANRLPITVRVTESGVEVERSTGGLATGLQGPHEQSDGLWIGWSGATEDLSPTSQAELEAKLAPMRLVAVPLPKDLVTRYYEGYSNGVLWPLFHYLLEQIPLQVSNWDSYVEANERFADVVAAHYQPGDLLWIHDYQLLLLPGSCDVGFPRPGSGSSSTSRFPPKSCFGRSPPGSICSEGMLGADLVGFHTPAYLRHFATSLTDILGLAMDIDRVQLPTGKCGWCLLRWASTPPRLLRFRPTRRSRRKPRRIRGDGSVRGSRGGGPARLHQGNSQATSVV